MTKTLLPTRSIAPARPPRVEPLSVLPVFLTLTGKRVVVIGGSDAAAWKAELLAQAGADVEIFAEMAENLAESMAQLLAIPPVNGSLKLIRRAWIDADLEGAALAVADIENDASACKFMQFAHFAGVPFNVIDRPEYCSFQFGSIVNRSPVVVGISTSGAAPILGQAVRRRIETLLPRSLSAWAALAARLRHKVLNFLDIPERRRAFWEAFAERAFSPAPQESDEEDADKLLFSLGKSAPTLGRVTLVGAGPGDADLLTLKAVRALQSADVILFDDLVSDQVLELARREAKRMLVGKRGGRESCRQEDINATMLALARQGKHVVRLKSGDPSIFGRAGEEIEELHAAGIPVDVVPGITTAIALAARLGISLTHRDHAQSVRFVTGHSRNGGLPETLDWRNLANPQCTTVYYMSRRTLPDILAQLAAENLPGCTPCVLAADLSRPDEAIWRGTVEEALVAADQFGLDKPFIFGVGSALGQRYAADQWMRGSAVAL